MLENGFMVSILDDGIVTVNRQLDTSPEKLQEKIKEYVLELSTSLTHERRMQLELHLEWMELALNNTDGMMAETRSRYDSQ